MTSPASGGRPAEPAWSLRRVQEPAQTDDLRIPPADVQRLVLLLGGTKTIESASGRSWRRAEHRPGTVSLTAPGRATQLRWRATSPQTVVTLQAVLPGTLVREAAHELWGRRTAPVLDSLGFDDPTTVQLLKGLAAAEAARAPELYAETAVRFLVVHLLTRYAALPAPAPVPREQRRTARVRAHMREHLAEPLTLVDLATVAGLSPWHFLRVFKAEHRTTPVRYLAALRLRTAQEMLASTTASVTEVAYACGFSSPGHLTTAFQRALGTTPSRYRQELGRQQAGEPPAQPRGSAGAVPLEGSPS
ncbi:helix-turn-helix domain-containing protein [Microlunatus flavus]|uniref:AraC family transcriptional regulator n=1 Tax=Microlunatus flavus TaxID=1036181 RepID=A0A1H9EQ49_9ACTN|nr:AraC family transcriptional regulator [Microlunatus flavus]SEQ27834.1 AraC family transcriptional regulator [Microlunatus flavus]